MSTNGVDQKKRLFLTAATTAVGGVGVAFASVPFITAMQPSAKAQAAGAPVEVDISSLKPGELKIVKWRGKPVWVVRRTEEALKAMTELTDKLRDPNSEEELQPDYAKNDTRAIKSEYLIVVGICSHLGCSPSYVKATDPHDLGSEWKGGFFCPCHGSLFDLAGRVYKDVPAPMNLEVPPHNYLSETRIQIGVDTGEGAA